MVDAGLMPGDTVIVEKNAPAKPGDIVDNEFTVKHLTATVRKLQKIDSAEAEPAALAAPETGEQ